MKNILSWDKPKKVRSSKEHEEKFSSDSGVPGTYVPNMSEEDMNKWKAKVVGTKSGVPQVEIRKTLESSSLLCIIAGEEGYNYKYYRSVPDHWNTSTKGLFLHISANGPIQMTEKDWEEFKEAVDEAAQKLKDL